MKSLEAKSVLRHSGKPAGNSRAKRSHDGVATRSGLKAHIFLLLLWVFIILAGKAAAQEVALSASQKQDPPRANVAAIRETGFPLPRNSGDRPRPKPYYPVASPALPNDQNLYSGIWLPGTFKQQIFNSLTFDDFTGKWKKLGKQQFRMDDFEALQIDNSLAYMGVFNEGTDKFKSFITADWVDFTNKWDKWGKKNLRMHDFETYMNGQTRMYAGIFRYGTDGNAAVVLDDWNAFTAQWDVLGRENLRMHDFETYEDNGHRWYAGIFREGTDNHAAIVTSDWVDFAQQWTNFENQNLRMNDYEVYDDNGTTFFAGIFREGTGGHYAWLNVEWENVTAKWQELMPYNLRMVDLEVTATSACEGTCMNQVVMRCAPDVKISDCVYDYYIKPGIFHCQEDPDSCALIHPGVLYHQPATTVGSSRYIRLSALDIQDQIFTLPFSDQNLTHNGWLYSPGSWHHAVDYSNPTADTFQVKAAAPGRVIYIGWDEWSGNTMIVSHDVGQVKDVYRTIYMHMRNGPLTDCAAAWSQTIPYLQTFDDQTPYQKYKIFLEATGCPSDPANRDPNSVQWGIDSQSIDTSLLGAYVQRGQLLGYAGSTGPGGCGCSTDGSTDANNHLHIFFARRNPQDDQWYLFDPYGIYGPSQCYPPGMTDPLNTPCVRYPVAWENGAPAYP